MALPKEPRQKMINMMYLVLTALLALNVSAEIINAFKTVENSLTKSNNTLSAASDKVYEGLKQSLEDPKTREKASIWAPKAAQVKELSDKLAIQIEGLKERVKKEGGYDPAKGDTSNWYNNLEAATRVMDKEGEGEKLHVALEQFKKDILAIDPEIAKKFASSLPINTEPPKSESGNTNQTWTTAYFHMTPTIAAVTILSKFQNDVKNTENKVASFCAEQIGAVKIIYDKFEPMVGTNSTYLMPGEQMEVKAGLGAFNSDVKPSVTIDGRPIPVNANGVAETKFAVGGSGSRKMHVQVKYVDPNTGETKSIDKDVEYTVGMPSGVSVSADKMNVLYIGVDNPLTLQPVLVPKKQMLNFLVVPLAKQVVQNI
jgi:gliding motility-associated protein GldM